VLERKLFDEIYNFTVNTNPFDEKLILKQGKCSLSPPILDDINCAEKSDKKSL
jgi:hypothetical protein